MKGVAILAVLAVLGGSMLGGWDAAGRLALRAQMPEFAGLLFTDTHWRGVAAYRAGDFDRAATSFEESGDTFALGNAHAYAYRYALALIAYDAALARDPDDGAALRNAELVAELYGGTEINGVPLRFALPERDGETVAAPEGQGGARAQGTGDEASNAGTSFETPQLESSGLRRVPRMFDDKYIAASERWMNGMPDEPAIYLKARLRAERKRREALGTAPARERDAW
jgi:Ca-activated chloride channel family protein